MMKLTNILEQQKINSISFAKSILKKWNEIPSPGDIIHNSTDHFCNRCARIIPHGLIYCIKCPGKSSNRPPLGMTWREVSYKWTGMNLNTLFYIFLEHEFPNYKMLSDYILRTTLIKRFRKDQEK